MDAIAIPAGRPVTQRFRRFLELAEALDCPVVVLCSRAATARDVTALAGAGVDLFAVDVLATAREALPPLETLTMLRGTPFAPGTDIALKRNLALLLAQLAGWERMVFFDDDVSHVDPEDIRRASALLDTYDAVGPAIDWFPDGSVVGHAERELGRPTERYVSCGTLAVAPIRTASFFPEIYNEDWLYLLDKGGPRTVAVTGTARQDPYDPFADPTRARCEEMGEVVVVGLYWVMANGGVATDADEPFWREYIDARLDLIGDLAARVAAEHPDVSHRTRVLACLAAARECLRDLTPALCAAYVRAWVRDCQVWRRHLPRAGSSPSPSAALSRLGLYAVDAG